MFCARLFICASWSPAGKGLTSWLSFVVSSVSLSLSHCYPGSGVVLDCIDSWSLQPYLLWYHSANNELYIKLRHKWKVGYPIVVSKIKHLNIVKYVEISFENPYTVWGCIFKATEGTLRNEPNDVVMWRHLTQTVTSLKKIGIKIMATSTTKCFNTVWQRQNELLG